VTSAVSVPNERIPEHAEGLLSHPVGRDALALAFSESSASSAEVLVGGDSFFPRMLADIKAASSSVHVNQFGFRPGVVGDSFADALIAATGGCRATETRRRVSTVRETTLGTHSEVGKLRTVMVHRPDLTHERLSPSNCHELRPTLANAEGRGR
jgi:hypothetical protein